MDERVGGRKLTVKGGGRGIKPGWVCRLVLPRARTGFQEGIVYIACPKPQGGTVFTPGKSGIVVPLLTRAGSDQRAPDHQESGISGAQHVQHFTLGFFVAPSVRCAKVGGSGG